MVDTVAGELGGFWRDLVKMHCKHLEYTLKLVLTYFLMDIGIPNCLDLCLVRVILALTIVKFYIICCFVSWTHTSPQIHHQ